MQTMLLTEVNYGKALISLTAALIPVSELGD
jgi:hypothetical protein